MDSKVSRCWLLTPVKPWKTNLRPHSPRSSGEFNVGCSLSTMLPSECRLLVGYERQPFACSPLVPELRGPCRLGWMTSGRPRC